MAFPIESLCSYLLDSLNGLHVFSNPSVAVDLSASPLGGVITAAIMFSRKAHDVRTPPPIMNETAGARSTQARKASADIALREASHATTTFRSMRMRYPNRPSMKGRVISFWFGGWCLWKYGQINQYHSEIETNPEGVPFELTEAPINVHGGTFGGVWRFWGILVAAYHLQH